MDYLNEPNHSVLVVDDDEPHRLLMKYGLPKRPDIHVDIAESPEDATFRMDTAKHPFQVIISDYNFKNSKINGLEFLGYVSQKFPLSARLLCSAQFSTDEMIEFVRKQYIHSYATKPIDLKKVSSAIDIGVAHHKLNQLQKAVDDVDLESNEELEKSVGYLSEVNRLVGSSFFVRNDYDGRDAEFEELKAKSETLIKRFDESFQRSGESIHLRNLNILKRYYRIEQTKLIAGQRDLIIQRLKSEFGDK